MAPAVATCEPRNPSHTVLYKVIAEHLETFLASLDADPDATGLPAYVQREFYDYLQCGILAHGFLRLGCDTRKHEMLLAFSCKRRGFCPSCGPADGPDGGTSGRVCRPLGPDAPMGGVGTHPLAVLDGSFKGPDGKGPYDYSDHDRTVRREPSSQTWHRAAAGPTTVGDVSPAIRRQPQFESPFSCCLP
jgi:hypothetical protein